jgi:diacylglycerol kinase (ATP)
MFSNLFFIINGRIPLIKIEEIKRISKEYFENNSCHFLITQKANETTSLANQAIEKNASAIISVGGDGTLHEVLQAVVGKNIPLGIIPMGSGNGLARQLNIDLNYKKALLQFKNCKIVKIDIGKLNDRYFINSLGFGFDAKVCDDLRNAKFRGLKMYVYYFIKNYFSYKPKLFSLKINDEEFEDAYFMISIANGKQFGYNFNIAPKASLNDGFFDIILIKKMNLWQGMKFIINSWQKKNTASMKISYKKAKHISMQTNEKMYQCDGDAFEGNAPFEITFSSHQLQVIVPKSLDLNKI